jgi:hypothetical protein
MIIITEEMREEWEAWVSLLESNKGAPWQDLSKEVFEGKLYTDASGRRFGAMLLKQGKQIVTTAGVWGEEYANKHIQLKEAIAFQLGVEHLVHQYGPQLSGKTVCCQIDNQAVLAIMKRKGTGKVPLITEIGKKLFYLQQALDFTLHIEYVPSRENLADSLTRQNAWLDISMDRQAFLKVWENYGPFKWDLMASAANVMKDFHGNPLLFFSRYPEYQAQGTDLFCQDLSNKEGFYCFPPEVIAGKVVYYLKKQKVQCVIIIPQLQAYWYTILMKYVVSSFQLAAPGEKGVFSVQNAGGMNKSFVYTHGMLACLANFCD